MCEGGRGLASISVKVQTKVRDSCACAMFVFLVLATETSLYGVCSTLPYELAAESQNVPLKKGDLHVLKML